MRVWKLAALLMVGLAGNPVAAQTSAPDEAAVTAVVDAFHAALKSGNSAAAMRLLAPDVLLIEVGAIETRTEYEKNHLPADIEFEKTVSNVHKPYRVTVAGTTAWAVTTSDTKGVFQNRAIDAVGVELMVLSHEPAGWQIRAVHWSARRQQPQ